MQKRTRRTLFIAVAVALIGSASALAGPVNGGRYVGSLPTSGTADYKHLHLQTYADGEEIILTVAHNGRTVTARFSSNHPFMFCRVEQSLKQQTTTPAAISRSGSFTATIGQKFLVQSGAPAVTQVITGRFSGRHVSGTIRTLAGECGGVSSFSASA